MDFPKEFAKYLKVKGQQHIVITLIVRTEACDFSFIQNYRWIEKLPGVMMRETLEGNLSEECSSCRSLLKIIILIPLKWPICGWLCGRNLKGSNAAHFDQGPPSIHGPF